MRIKQTRTLNIFEYREVYYENWFQKTFAEKTFRARTTGKWKRRAKKAVNPLYGKKGMGFIKNPKRSIKNKVYKKTTFGLRDLFK